jgi:hypothetical protein
LAVFGGAPSNHLDEDSLALEDMDIGVDFDYDSWQSPLSDSLDMSRKRRVSAFLEDEGHSHEPLEPEALSPDVMSVDDQHATVLIGAVSTIIVETFIQLTFVSFLTSMLN